MYKSFFTSSWLEEEDDLVVAKVNNRMEQITGLTVKTAELLQVSTETHYQTTVIQELVPSGCRDNVRAGTAGTCWQDLALHAPVESMYLSS